jgi:hypothetical protein
MDYCPISGTFDESLLRGKSLASGEDFSRNYGAGLATGEKRISFGQIKLNFPKIWIFVQFLGLLLNLPSPSGEDFSRNYGAGLASGEKFPLLAELSNAVDLKNPRPVPPDNGALEKKQRLHVYTTSGLDQRCR